MLSNVTNGIQNTCLCSLEIHGDEFPGVERNQLENFERKFN